MILFKRGVDQGEFSIRSDCDDIIILWISFMGNNHDKYFGSDKRKIIILGLDNAGKTTLLNFLSKDVVNFNTPKTKNLNIQDVSVGSLNVTFFDMAGGERQRVFWKQQFEGTQGIIFVIDATSSSQEREKSLQELDKLTKQMEDSIPIAVGLSKVDLAETISWSSYKATLSKSLQTKYSPKRTLKVGEIDYKSKESVKTLISWLLAETKPI